MSVRIITQVQFPDSNLSELVTKTSEYAKIDSLAREPFESQDGGASSLGIYYAKISFESEYTAKFLNALATCDGSIVDITDSTHTDVVIDEADVAAGRRIVISSPKSAEIRKKPKAKAEEMTTQPWKGSRKRRTIARLRHRSPKGETVKDRVRDFVKKGWKTMDEIRAHVGESAGLHARIFELKEDEGLQIKMKADGTKLYSIR